MKLKALAVLAAIVGLGLFAEQAHADAVSVTVSTTTVVSGTPSRRHLYIFNGGTSTAYLGTTTAQTTPALGYVLRSSDTLVMQEFSGTLYGITTSGTADLRVLKQTR